MTKEEKLEEAKRLYKTSNADQKYVLERLFPELKESEDEKIMEALIDGFKRYDDGALFNGCMVRGIVAWLEKQVEHANFRNKIQIGDRVTRNEDGVLVNLSQLKRVAKKDENQGEQKPDNWFQELEDKLANATPKQLAEWKEKYFKENHTEWSEQDEYNKRQVCRILREAGCSQTLQIKINSWLESFRFQSTWKPSGEQITVLHDFAAYIDNSIYPNQKDILVNLYLQLKKLREE